MTNITSMSDESLKSFLVEVGIPESIVKDLFKAFRKFISPQPKGYISHNAITRLLVANCFTWESLRDNIVDKAKITVLGNLCQKTVIPWYWLSKDLALDLAKTDPPSSIPRNIALPEYGIIVLPKETISTATGEPSFIAYKLFNPRENSSVPALMQGEKDKNWEKASSDTYFSGEDGYRLVWCSIENECVYGGITGLIPEALEYKIAIEDAVFLDDPDREKREADILISILLGSLTYATQFEAEYYNSSPKLGFSQTPKKSKCKYERPLYIGSSYSSPSRLSSTSNGTGTKKKIHWRRGYWRRVATGEGRVNREWRLIAPTMVGVKPNVESEKELPQSTLISP